MTQAATVVFSFGMGVDSAAILHEWTVNPLRVSTLIYGGLLPASRAWGLLALF